MCKWISILLVVAILMTNLSAFAEQGEEKGLLGTIGGFVTDTINNAGDAIGNATSDVSGLLNNAGDAIGNAASDVSGLLNDAGDAIGNAANDVSGLLNDAGDAIGSAASDVSGLLNDAGDAIGNALNDAGDAIGSAASDAGNSITNALSDAGKGFLEFWKNTGEQVGDAWNWAAVSVSETGNAINNSARETLGNLRTWLAISGDNALNTLRGVFGEVASGLGMAADKAAELWDSIQRYAEARNINMVVLVKLAVAIMIRVKMKNDTALGRMAGTYIDEIVMDWFDDFNIDSDKAAAHALSTLDTSLENAFQGSQN